MRTSGMSASERAALEGQVSACQDKLKQIADKMAAFHQQVARAPNAPMKKRLQQQAEDFEMQVLCPVPSCIARETERARERERERDREREREREMHTQTHAHTQTCAHTHTHTDARTHT